MNETYYWYGFILADGTLRTKRSCKLGLAYKDESHVFKFANFFGKKTICYSKKYCYVNTILDEKMIEILDIKKNKTYNPPKLDGYKSLSNNEILSLFIGLIDGDGCIIRQYKREDSLIRIKTHASWLNFYLMLHSRIESICNIETPKPKINNQGYMSWIISNHLIIHFLYDFILDYQSIILQRKWTQIKRDKIYKT